MKAHGYGADAVSPSPDGLPQVAVGWLREILRSEFAAEPTLDAAPRERGTSHHFDRDEWLRVVSRIRVLGFADQSTGPDGNGQLAMVLDHAWAAAEHDEPLTLVAVAIDTDGMEASVRDRALSAAAEVLGLESGSCGIVLRCSAPELLVVLPQVDAPSAEALIARTRDCLGTRARLHAGLAARNAEITSAEQLLAHARRALASARS
ncbi:MAG TPA: hypothetical protein VGR27_03805 [Longimicrobiaceae bacterium]|nr:hypothetical protein [Longimicrobiaceae bacterium]